MAVDAPSSTEAGSADHAVLWPAFYLAAAALVIGFINPLHIYYRPQLLLTLLLVGAGAGLLAWAVARRRRGIFYGAASLLLSIIGLCLATQPAQLLVPSEWIWPLRLTLFLVVAGTWLALVHLPAWARRALTAAAGPFILLLVCGGGPPLTTQLLGWTPVPPAPFQPYWLAADSRGTIYATDANGNFIWVFASSGALRGTLWPVATAWSGDSGPGIVPAGYPTPVARVTDPATPLPFLLNTPTPVRISAAAALAVPNSRLLTFCGIAVDPQDHLYVVDDGDRVLLQFDAAGILRGRWPLPPPFAPVRGCLTADAEHVFLLSRLGVVYAFDKSGKVAREISLASQPSAITAAGGGKLIALEAAQINHIDVASGQVTTVPIPPSNLQLRVSYGSLVVEPGGEILATNTADNRLVRLVAQTGEVVASFGEEGPWPGQFLGLGGLARDPSGRIYAADWRLGVIQRFSAGGKLDHIIRARGEPLPTPILERE